MFSMEITLVGLALAIDAAVATFALGVMTLHLPRQHKFSRGLYLASLFGIFQFLMLWLGSYGGYLFTFSSFGHHFLLIVTAIFMLIAGKLFQESFKSESKQLKWGLAPTLILAFATSIDALATGVSLGTLPDAYLSALEVGIITFVVCAAAYVLSQNLKNLPEKWLLRVAGVIFLFLSLRVLSDYSRLGA